MSQISESHNPDADSSGEDLTSSSSTPSASSSNSSVPLSSLAETDSYRSRRRTNNGGVVENETLSCQPQQRTSLRAMGLNDSRKMVKAGFTWHIDKWETLSMDATQCVASPRIKIEGFSWRFLLYPRGTDCSKQTTVVTDKKGKKRMAHLPDKSDNVGLYIRARPLKGIKYNVKAEMELELSRPLDSNDSTSTDAVIRVLKDETLGLTPTVRGEEKFASGADLRRRAILTRDGRLDVTVRLKLII